MPKSPIYSLHGLTCLHGPLASLLDSCDGVSPQAWALKENGVGGDYACQCARWCMRCSVAVGDQDFVALRMAAMEIDQCILQRVRAEEPRILLS